VTQTPLHCFYYNWRSPAQPFFIPNPVGLNGPPLLSHNSGNHITYMHDQNCYSFLDMHMFLNGVSSVDVWHMGRPLPGNSLLIYRAVAMQKMTFNSNATCLLAVIHVTRYYIVAALYPVLYKSGSSVSSIFLELSHRISWF
jgi:hypothetical protein